MPIPHVIDLKASYAALILLSAAPKMKFGTDQPDVTRDGEPKYTVQVAATGFPFKDGMAPESEILTVGIVGGALPTIPAGTPVEFERLRAGVSQAQVKDNGKGVSGGRNYYMGEGLRPAAPSFRSSKSSEAAA